MLKACRYLTASVLFLLLSFNASASRTSQCQRYDEKCQNIEKVQSVMQEFSVEYEVAEAALILATHDLAIHNCHLEISFDYKNAREKILRNEKIAKLRDYSRINTIFLPFLY